ncbi:bifunctional diguanylate cyclase/phosphodiesterase [Rheinheimera baltica]|uniref:Bifunctional diguanylate cyclase/phosphodiesterase n=1 Tax=Rheinheimera baltica TaxID=67576 RepID=A0ABT9HXC0_9GAMM|nr:bifunctional diguanylate cyclase/phosphodiesterase [Rheinheimera baltica]MDP5135770.1 bifunctional diguanylate cyclase/phosphodiesterase [Rheinheimera baltica]MDP5142354.1 bifunctional diguanylate cyclase/phosphodiesterase [Rheinheimera baltica]MDP5150744.1 bifunctional diguanylate cyclase/phosphodiesterase [Rheinheimera baltica]
MRYLSLSWKMLILLLSILLVLITWFTSLSLLHMNQQFNRQQAQRKAQGQQYFQLYNQSVDQQLLSWMQSFADLQNLHEAAHFGDFSHALALQADSLQMNYAVQGFSLFYDGQVQLRQGDIAQDDAHALVQQTLLEQRPISNIHCDKHCTKSLSLPLLNSHGDVAILVLETTLTDVLFSLHRTLSTEVAILKRRPGDTLAQQFAVLQASDHEQMRRIAQYVPDDMSVDTILRDGVIIFFDNSSYFLHLIPLNQQAEETHFLLMVEDVTQGMQDKQRYEQQIFTVAGSCFIAVLLLILYITRRISRRILKLAAALPLLAQRRYAEFRQQSLGKPGMFQDELNTFNDSVLRLSHELEHLDLQLADNTASLERMAMFDTLTGLANRNMLQYQIQQALASLAQRTGYVGLLFLDLDKFKTVNNSRSHAIGDQLLIETSQRLRAVTSAAEVVCRFGGDEFVIVLSHLDSPSQIEELAVSVMAQFTTPFTLEHVAVTLSASIGISYTNNPQYGGDELIRQADLAMYQAKNNGRNCYVVFNEKMSSDLAARLQLEVELRQAISQQQFSLSLQPQVDLRSGRLFGFEALLRWQHPTRGLVPPDEFISVLEQTQLIVDVGYWVFERSCQRYLDLMGLGLHDVIIAVNVAADQFLQPDFALRLADILQKYQLSASHFELELTESTLVSHVSQTLDAMHQLKLMGFRFAIDDFGTGYSSLNYIKQMPVDTIKIDKSFVMAMLESSSDYQIIVSTIAMVQKLGLQVVAEGVESLAHLQLLQQYHCDLAQGYYLSRPIPETQLADFVREQVLQQNWPAALLRRPEH